MSLFRVPDRLRIGTGLGHLFLALALALVLGACGGRAAPAVAEDRPAPYSPLDTPSYATAKYQSDANASAYFEPLFADKVLVLKSERKLMLVADGQPFRTYDISLGFAPRGDKLAEGDGRTPEGRYLLDWKNRNSEYYKSIHISYPNARDRARARAAGVDPGDNIMIHGLGPEMAFLGKTHRAADWTNGCIAVTNREMDEIWLRVRPGTPIEIRP